METSAVADEFECQPESALETTVANLLMFIRVAPMQTAFVN